MSNPSPCLNLPLMTPERHTQTDDLAWQYRAMQRSNKVNIRSIYFICLLMCLT